jgi:hypothetical protein
MLNEPSRSILRRHGWHESRKINSDHYVALLTAEGLPVFRAAVAFTEEFGGLSVSFTNGKNGLEDTLSFDGERALELEYPERILEDYAVRLTKALAPVGTVFREYMILLIDEVGALYGGYCDTLVKFGHDSASSLNFILNLPPTSKAVNIV